MSRKFLVTIVLILFLLPFVSWYYLRSGLDWRKQAQQIMNGTSPFPSGTFLTTGEKPLITDELEEYVSIITFLPCDSDSITTEILLEIYEQFKSTEKAKYILLDSCINHVNTSVYAQKKNWYVIRCWDTTHLCQQLLPEWPTGKTFALVDRNKVIRSYYSSQTKDEKRVLVEHMALLLPRERQEKVELKRGDKK